MLRTTLLSIPEDALLGGWAAAWGGVCQCLCQQMCARSLCLQLFLHQPFMQVGYNNLVSSLAENYPRQYWHRCKQMDLGAILWADETCSPECPAQPVSDGGIEGLPEAQVMWGFSSGTTTGARSGCPEGKSRTSQYVPSRNLKWTTLPGLLLQGSIKMATVNLPLCSLSLCRKNNTTETQPKSSSLVTAPTQFFWVYFNYHLNQSPETNCRLLCSWPSIQRLVLVDNCLPKIV